MINYGGKYKVMALQVKLNIYTGHCGYPQVFNREDKGFNKNILFIINSDWFVSVTDTLNIGING